MASEQFTVVVRDIGGRRITIECTSDTPISHLINTFRKGVSSMHKRKEIVLMRDDYSLINLSGTVGDNEIHDGDELVVVYKGILSCINPQPISETLHHWIEHTDSTFKFKHDKRRAYRPFQECTDLLTEYNNWTKDEQYIFFLTERPQFDDIYTFDSTMNGYNGPIDYASKKSDSTLTNDIKYNPTPDILPQMGNMSSIRGTLNDIIIEVIQTPIFQIPITQNKQTNNEKSESKPEFIKYIREFKIYVILIGPIEICNSKGTIIYSSNDLEIECQIPYDNILMCNSQGMLNIPNNNQGILNIPNNSQGGRRTKRTKHTKRSKNKRKTTRRTHKK